jgi:tryptophan-rich sensory protein
MRLILFLILNFGALILGALLMGDNPIENEWYQLLKKAPWTPPGWVFGFAWTLIMITYSFYLSHVFLKQPKQKWSGMILLFLLQFLLNVGWNPVFFALHYMVFGCLIIIGLLIVLIYFDVKYGNKGWLNRLLILPYIIWLCIALSLNFYSVISN